MKPFYLSFDPSNNTDVAIILWLSRETTKISKIRLPLWPLFACLLTSLHSTQLHHLHHYSCALWCLFPAHLLASFYFLRIISAPPPSSTYMFMWTAKMESARSHHYFDFQHLYHVPAKDEREHENLLNFQSPSPILSQRICLSHLPLCAYVSTSVLDTNLTYVFIYIQLKIIFSNNNCWSPNTKVYSYIGQI